MFRILKTEGKKRIGILETKSGEIRTPFFMPIATKGAVKNILPSELKEIGAQIVLGNTYHLWLRPGDAIVKKNGGLHGFMDWKGPILTDSGGFQVFSLGARAVKRFGKNGVEISEKGVYFIDPENGSKHFMSPEKSIEIQLNLDSDIIMVLDQCTSENSSHSEVKEAVERSIRWAKQCKTYFEKKTRTKLLKKMSKVNRPLLFAIVQGGNFRDLREYCARELVKIGFDGYALGGMVPIDELDEVGQWLAPILPEDKPRYIMGIGKPEEIVRAVQLGFDMFDCVMPTREGRHGRLFIKKGNFPLSISKTGVHTRNLKKTANCPFYSTINIKNEKYKALVAPVDKKCNCMLCSKYSKAYLRHLLAVKEPLGLKLAALHNLKFYLDMMRVLRNENESTSKGETNV